MYFQVEFDSEAELNSDDLAETLARFFKASVMNSTNQTGIWGNDYILAAQYVVDFLSGAEIWNKGGIELGDEERSSVLSEGATLLVSIDKWVIEVSFAENVLSVGSTAKVVFYDNEVVIIKGDSAIVGADISLSIRSGQ